VISFGLWLLFAFTGPALIAFLLPRLGAPTKEASAAARYRLGVLAGLLFLVTLFLMPILLGLPSRDDPPGLFPAAAFLGLAGSLFGAAFASLIEFGAVENNSPPAPEIERDVLEHHHARIGQAPPLRPLKRLFDILLAMLGLALTAPLWIVFSLLIWLEDPGPVVFVKNSVGRGGRNFAQLKFRTMVRNAEEQTGPIPARQTDERILRSGRFLRKTALDELPQLLNILVGEMSFVGPRPLRTIVVREYLRQLPAFAERHRVQPGLAGLAQVVGDYYVPLRSRLRLDRLYAEHAGLVLDLRLLWLAMMIVFWYRWKKNWSGRLPRRWLHARPS
jgi:lipopolysaccharide/colanic/teichoic acid biosynthesis glycosyltransferase